MSKLDHLCCPKKFRAIISKNFISVHGDTSLVKYRVNNKMYTGTRMISTGVYKNLYIPSLVKSPDKYRGSPPVNNNILFGRRGAYNCVFRYPSCTSRTTRLFVVTRHYTRFLRIRPWYSQETIRRKKFYIIILLDPILIKYE